MESMKLKAKQISSVCVCVQGCIVVIYTIHYFWKRVLKIYISFSS